MKQYNEIKVKYPDALLLFRVGDFYETFGDDAVRTADILGIVLTKRGAGSASETELAGFPYHALETYLPKLVRAGERVAICDQLEDPKATKKLVKRGVTELITPGVTLTDGVLDEKSNNFVAALHINNQIHGLSFLDISTGEFQLTQGSQMEISILIQQLAVKEILVAKTMKEQIVESYGAGFPAYYLEDWVFQENYATERLQGQFGVASLKGFGITDLHAGIIAAGVILYYLNETEHAQLDHITHIHRLDREVQMWMDPFTIRNLELIYPNAPQATTLLQVMDHTKTPMGGRMLKRWLVAPLTDLKAIEKRLSVVTDFYQHSKRKHRMQELLQSVGDLERLMAKVATGRIGPRAINQLKNSLLLIPKVTEITSQSDQEALRFLGEGLDSCSACCQWIKDRLSEDAPTQLGKGDTIASGYSVELDDYRSIARDGKKILDEMLERETEKTGISSLKISFNNVFGYYIEVRNTHKDKVPETWIRKQTLVNAERYITEELKVYETKIIGAEDHIAQLEQRLFQELVKGLLPYIKTIQNNARILAELDCLCGFASLAKARNYHCPVLNDGDSLTIVQGRHPVIEYQMPPEESYIPNDLVLNKNNQQIIMITGPNMSGKSAVLRQTALIVLMAQVGSYIPADRAEIGFVDKLFTRVGANDNISLGESTFMVEMNETAAIVNNLSSRSLVLLDEIGRGTSTYDGISIAWAIATYLHEHPHQPKTLYATHYHELNEMTEQHERIQNYTVSVKELRDDVLFLRKLVPGGSAHSFGIHVAKMAGMPQLILQQSKQLLEKLEVNRGTKETEKDDEMQLNFFQMNDPLLEEIRDQIMDLDIDHLTPMDALMQLNSLRKKLGKKKDL
ncbi:MAG: DNA mismatch repair protein MutS [Bacteroidota bacterium]|nr:DNA mismatch repair protein MutS [Bacteroidota bacterium]